MEEIEVHHAQIEEEEGHDKRGDAPEGDDLERDVALRADDFVLSAAFPFHLTGRQSDGALDDAPRLHDADDARHGDAADADGACIGLEDGFRGHLSDGCRDGRIPLVQYGVGEDEGHARHDEPPDGKRTHADDEGVFQPDDVTQSEDGGTCIHLEDELRLVGNCFAEADHAAGHVFVPPAEGRHGEVVETAHQARHEQRLRLASAPLAAHEHLCSCRGLGERISAVLVLDEVFAERNQKENAQHTAQCGGDENLEEVGLQVEHIDGRHDEDAACHDGTRAGTDALDDDVLAQCVLPLRGGRKADSDDGDRYGRFKHLPHLQSEVGGCCREEHGHEDSPRDRPWAHLPVGFLRRHDRFVCLAVFQLPEGVFRQFNVLVRFIFHCLNSIICLQR